MDSDTSSDIDYEEDYDKIIIEQDIEISDLKTKNEIQSAFIEVLKDRIIDLKNIINSKLPSHLNAILEYL